MRVPLPSWVRARVAAFVALSVAIGFLTAINQVAALVLAGVVFVVVVVMTRPGIAGVILISVVPVTSGLRANAGSVSPAELLIVLLTILLAAVPRRSVPWDRLDQLLLVFVVAAVG